MTHYLNHHRALRKAMEGRTLREVARKGGLPVSTVRWLKAGRRDLKLGQLFKVWKALGYDVSIWLTPKDRDLPAYILNDVGIEDK
jgi:transcriptional regulator with XRE-family HTH domain